MQEKGRKTSVQTQPLLRKPGISFFNLDQRQSHCLEDNTITLMSLHHYIQLSWVYLCAGETVSGTRECV